MVLSERECVDEDAGTPVCSGGGERGEGEEEK